MGHYNVTFIGEYSVLTSVVTIESDDVTDLTDGDKALIAEACDCDIDFAGEVEFEDYMTELARKNLWDFYGIDFVGAGLADHGVEVEPLN